MGIYTQRMGAFDSCLTNLKELGMVEALDTFLAGLKPELNDGFDVLTGIYAVVIKNEEKAETGFMVRTWQDGNESRRFQITVDVTDVLKGNGNPGRRLWMRYNEDEKGIQRLVNDLFTAGILDKVDRTSIESLKTTLPNLAGQAMYVRAWGWKREGDDQEKQSVSVKSEKALKKLLEEKAEVKF